jgi:inhibitor of cysteine peptidase
VSVLKLTEAENGETIHVRSGDVIELRLPENATTGYRWEVTSEAGLVEEEVAALPSISDIPEPPVVGGGGLRVFRFRPRPVGVGRLELKLWRPFEGEASVTNRFSVEITILD